MAYCTAAGNPGTWVSNVALYVNGDAIIAGTLNSSHISTTGLDAGVIKAGVIYNTGGSAGSYTMKIDLDNGSIYIA